MPVKVKHSKGCGLGYLIRHPPYVIRRAVPHQEPTIMSDQDALAPRVFLARHGESPAVWSQETVISQAPYK